MSLQQMRVHIAALAEAHDIAIDHRFVRRCTDAYSIRQLDEVHTPPVKSELSYAVALHEIGHIFGRFQNSKCSMVRERWAWNWARANAINWSPRMEHYAVASLDHIATRSASRRLPR